METIASIENLEDLNASLGACLEETGACFDEAAASLGRLSEAAEAERTAATQALEEAEENVVQCESLVDSIEDDLSSLSSDDEDDKERERLEAELDEARAELDEAKKTLAACQERHEKAMAICQKAETLRETFLQQGRTSLRRLSDLQDDSRSRLRQACMALERYMAEHPGSSTAAFGNWVRWTPTSSTLVSPQTLANRLRLSPAHLRQLVAYEAERDPAFRAKIEGYQRQYASATSLVERSGVLRQARRNGSGELAERMVATAFRPLGDVSTQDRTYFDDGRFTKTDLIVRNLRSPVLFGKGEHVFAPKGGSIALEVKAGQASYLRSQKEHLVFQAGGHRATNASATLCTADVHDLGEEERALRDSLRTAGSPLIGMVPRKRDIDRALYEAIAHGISKDIA